MPSIIQHSSSTGATAPAKLILCGEHAVVYGRPAIALPLSSIRARVEIAAGPPGSGIHVEARDIGRAWSLAADSDDPLSMLVHDTLQHGRTQGSSLHLPDLSITITSDIPIASGMGSGASVATALVRALSAYLRQPLTNAQVSALVYESEKRLHGTPSGIDNTVVAYEMPVWFVGKEAGRKQKKEQQSSETAHPSSFILHPSFEPIAIAAPFTLLIADTGVRSATRLPVGAVRDGWQAATIRYELLFDQIGALVRHAREILASGHIEELGPLLNENHALLQELGVSSPELDRLVMAAREAGALGAKLSGAGWGGVVLALVEPSSQHVVAEGLHAAGAPRVLTTEVAATEAA